MRFAILALLIAVAGTPAPAAEDFAGSYTCRYLGDWVCAAPPDGICIDGGARPRGAKRYTLRLDFATRRISLNDIDGRFEPDDRLGDYWVSWEIRGLGNPKLRPSLDDGALRVELVQEIPGLDGSE